MRKWRDRRTLQFMKSEAVRLPDPVFQVLLQRTLRRQLSATEPLQPLDVPALTTASQRLQPVALAERTHAERRKADLQPRDRHFHAR